MRIPLRVVLLTGLLTPCVLPAAAQVAMERRVTVAGRDAWIQVWAAGETAAQSALDAGAAAWQRIGERYSMVRQGSLVNRINEHAAQRPVAVDPEEFRHLQTAKEICRRTEGAYDFTVAVYRVQYGFGLGAPNVPPTARLHQLQPLVDYRYLLLDPTERTVLLKRQGVMIDLDDFLPGWAVAEARAAALAVKQVSAVRIRSAEAACEGGQPAEPGMVDVHDPGRAGSVLARVPLGRGLLLLATTDQQTFTQAGHRYHPFLDPRTGEPAVYTRMAVLSLPPQQQDRLIPAALLVVPDARARELIHQVPGAEALLLARDGKVWTTPGWSPVLPQ